MYTRTVYLHKEYNISLHILQYPNMLNAVHTEKTVLCDRSSRCMITKAARILSLPLLYYLFKITLNEHGSTVISPVAVSPVRTSR